MLITFLFYNPINSQSLETISYFSDLSNCRAKIIRIISYTGGKKPKEGPTLTTFPYSVPRRYGFEDFQIDAHKIFIL